MHFTNGSRSLFFHILCIFYGSSLSVASPDDCEIGLPGNRLITSVQMVKHTVHIIATITDNTTLHIGDGLTIPVDNAPTSLDVITTYDTESTYLSMAHPSVVSAREGVNQD